MRESISSLEKYQLIRDYCITWRYIEASMEHSIRVGCVHPLSDPRFPVLVEISRDLFTPTNDRSSLEVMLSLHDGLISLGYVVDEDRFDMLVYHGEHDLGSIDMAIDTLMTMFYDAFGPGLETTQIDGLSKMVMNRADSLSEAVRRRCQSTEMAISMDRMTIRERNGAQVGSITHRISMTLGASEIIGYLERTVDSAGFRTYFIHGDDWRVTFSSPSGDPDEFNEVLIGGLKKKFGTLLIHDSEVIIEGLNSKSVWSVKV